MTEHLDVVIVGAGISGVSAAWHLQDRCPTKSYAILEKRESMGGTWDLFRYPGIRSDGFDTVVVERPGSDVEERPFMEFTPGYVLRSLDELPKQGSRTPWRLNQNYLRDIRLIRRGKIDDEGLRFAKRPAPVGV